MNEREKIKKTIRRGSQERQQKKTAATYEGGKTNKRKETLQIAIAAKRNPKTRREKKMARNEKKWHEKKKKWRGSISMKRDNTSRSQKKRGTGYDPSLFTHADTTGREKKNGGNGWLSASAPKHQHTSE